MLKQLEISNYALIENVKLKLDNNFTVITGETGAGKSILLKALGLILGERADISVIKRNENKCVLEAQFDISQLGLHSFFTEADLDYDETCLVRREFTASGKSRAFINDSPVQVNQLKELGERLINIHTQHQTLLINTTAFQFDVLDQFAGIANESKQYEIGFYEYRKKVDEKLKLQLKEMQSRKDKDYLEFLVNELSAANLQKINIDELKTKDLKLQNAEKITENLKFASSIFENEDVGPIASTKALIEAFENLKEFDLKFADILSRLHSVKIELADIENDLGGFISEIEIDEEEAQLVKDQMDSLNSLIYKHNVHDIQGLIDLENELSVKLNAIQDVSDELAKIEKEIAIQENDLKKKAIELRAKREKAIPEFKKLIEVRLHDMSIPDAQFGIQLEKLERLSKFGLDDISYLFSANKGSELAPLKKVASGGELSRLMLALLESISGKKKLPTMIFDEIDTGVSGEVATKMARTLKTMGQNMQVIAITHLPQVAAAGKNHLFVSKSTDETKTRTTVALLNPEERVIELAKMISGEKITDAAKENAQILLQNK